MTTKAISKKHFYMFEMFDNKGKWQKDAQLHANTYHKASSDIKKQYSMFHNHRLKNSDDPKCF